VEVELANIGEDCCTGCPRVWEVSTTRSAHALPSITVKITDVHIVWTVSTSNNGKKAAAKLFFIFEPINTCFGVPFHKLSKKRCIIMRHECAKVERSYSSYSFLTSALDGGRRPASRSDRALPPGKGPPVPSVQKAGWAPEPVWTRRLDEKSFTPAGNRTPVVQSVARL
jgi:hypothetical protein